MALQGNCEWCGAEFTAVSRAKRFCGGTCKARACTARAAASGKLDEWTAATLDRKRRKPESSVCQQCGVTFWQRHRRRYCSPKCRNRAFAVRRRDKPEYKKAKLGYDQARRARKHTDLVERFGSDEVFDRDRYICHICGVKCNPQLRVPEPLAPTLDHLVPLAKGGAHTLANVACACFTCNSVKGDRGSGEQLALI